jgi:hypothetical protein
VAVNRAGCSESQSADDNGTKHGFLTGFLYNRLQTEVSDTCLCLDRYAAYLRDATLDMTNGTLAIEALKKKDVFMKTHRKCPALEKNVGGMRTDGLKEFN